MLKQLFVVLFLSSVYTYSQDCDCDYFISTDQTYFNGETVLPGEVICLENGVREQLKIYNLQGSEEERIRIRNCGGVVKINHSLASPALSIGNSQYFDLTGESEAFDYGIQVLSSKGVGVFVYQNSQYFTLGGLKIEQTKKEGVLIQDKPRCDYSVNYGYYTGKNILLKNLMINNCAKGVQIGHPEFGTGMDHVFCGLLYPCGYQNVEITNCRLTQMYGGTGISLFGASGEVHHNQIKQTRLSGIISTGSPSVEMFNNRVEETGTHGIQLFGEGVHLIHHNVLVNNGGVSSGGIYTDFGPIIDDEFEQQLQIVHNTIVRSGCYGIDLVNTTYSSDETEIINNIIVNPQAVAFAPITEESYINNGGEVFTGYNVFEENPENVYFKNYGEGDFSLTGKSIALNAASVTSYTADINGEVRNLAGAPDCGAYEYVPKALAYFHEIELVGLYVDDFKHILGDESAETALLEFAHDKGFNYLLLYNLAYIHAHNYDLTDPEEAIVLANFIRRAKEDYGIVQVGAVGEKNASFNKIQTFNSLFGESWFDQFDVLNLEFEFWANTDSPVFDYYCENYMEPAGLPCTYEGAYTFYKSELEAIDERAAEMGIISEIYLGYQSDEESIELANRTDRILLHHYRTSDTYGDGSSIYNYHTNRIRAIALSDRKPAVMPIFSSRSYHMGPWLLTHTIHDAMETWRYGEDGYAMDDAEGVADLNIAGCQWYRYTSFPDAEADFLEHQGQSDRDIIKDEKYILVNNQQNTLHLSRYEYPENSRQTVQLYNLQGRLILHFTLESNRQMVDLNHLPSGMYLQVISEGEKIVQSDKIIVTG